MKDKKGGRGGKKSKGEEKWEEQERGKGVGEEREQKEDEKGGK